MLGNLSCKAAFSLYELDLLAWGLVWDARIYIKPRMVIGQCFAWVISTGDAYLELWASGEGKICIEEVDFRRWVFFRGVILFLSVSSPAG